MTRLSTLGELGLLAELEQRGLIVDVKNDAAQLAGGLIATQDAMVENVHFRLDWIGWRELGWRAAAASLSDLAASGADPEALVIGLALPAGTDARDVIELYEGIAETGVPVVGGDLTSADAVVIRVDRCERRDHHRRASRRRAAVWLAFRGWRRRYGLYRRGRAATIKSAITPYPAVLAWMSPTAQ